MKLQSQGFTLIELILVIVIMGVLAAVGLPKFVNLSHDARTAAILSATGAIKTAVVLVNSKVQTSGAAISNSITQLDVGGGALIDVQNGHPACTANGIAKAAGTDSRFVWYFGSSLCTLYPNMGTDGSGNTIYSGNCAVVYDPVAGGTWTPVTSGC